MRPLAAKLAAFGLAVVWGAVSASPGSAMPAAPLGGAVASPAAGAQFRFPWENDRKASRKTKRTTRGEKARPQRPSAAQRAKERKPPPKPAPGAKPAPGGKPAPGAKPPPVVPADPMDAALAAAPAPLDVAAPRGGTRREADAWAAVAARVPPPEPAPPPSPDGPAPISAATLAALAPLQRAQSAEAARTAAVRVDAEEAETPDMHVPLPPVRPRAPGEVAAAPEPRDGLSPGRGLGPEGGLSPESGVAPEGGLAPEGVPLPPKRPGGAVAALDPDAKAEPPPGPSAPEIALPVVAHDEDADCRALASEGVAEAKRIPPIEGPGVCGGGPLVSLTGVRRKDGELIKLNGAATLRCGMARELAAYLRDDVAPAAESSGAELVRLDIAGSFQCRGRNGAAGGKMSEHGRANAVDLVGFGFKDGKTVGVFAPDLPQGMPATLKATACGRFSTVLGPGSDGFHETHLHLDLQPRRSKAALCQWSDPEVARASEAGKSDAEGAKDPPDAEQEDSWPRRKASKPDAPKTPKDRAP